MVEGARTLLGCRLITPNGSGVIIETEAYRGQDDPGCHAFNKSTMRNMALFGEPGTAYVYLSYGMHWMLNVVAEPMGCGSGILLRALRPDVETLWGRDALRGPGRLARSLGVTPDLNGQDLFNREGAFKILPGSPVQGILVGRRIGLSVGKGEEREWRFVSEVDRQWASRPI